MKCRIADLRCKEVINICDGHRLGFVDDILVDVETGCVIALIVPGPCRYFGIFGREDDFIIAWERVCRVGDDIILIEVKEHKREKRHKRPWF